MTLYRFRKKVIQLQPAPGELREHHDDLGEDLQGRLKIKI